MPDRVFNIGVVGAGLVAQTAHLTAVRKSRAAELYAICDVAGDLLRRVANIHRPARTFADYDAMLDDENVDAVIVAVADEFHAPLSVKALEAGKHVLVEKPMATTVEDAQATAEAARRNDRVILVGHEKRYDPGVAFARDFIRDEIGQLIALKHWYADSTYRYSVTDTLQPIIESSTAALRPPGDPKGDRQRYYVLAHGSHLFDTARYLGGPIEAVRARLSTKAGTHCWFIEAAFADGCLGHLDLTVAVRMDWWEGFQVYGSEGSVLGKVFHPWYLRAAEVHAFSARQAWSPWPGRWTAATGSHSPTSQEASEMEPASRLGSAHREPAAALRAGRRGDDELGVRVVVNVRRAGDDHGGSGPRLLSQQERQLLQHPVRHVLHVLGGVAVAEEQQALLLVKIALHPHRGVQPRGELLADDAGTLDPDELDIGGDGDRSGPAVLDPGVRAEVHRLTLVQGPQDVLGEHGAPVEVGVVPGDVVGVHDGRVGHLAQSLGQGRLARAAPAVDRDHPRTSGDPGGRAAEPPDRVEQGHRPPADGLGLAWM
ncbi:Gfo/Idh/MocA family oxidoreductase [Nonomuraea sp. LP-02]|uniref:Gfo/Idh/MocA family protein n=1 Tax=Nonomuraea sp. LP-02 TaxID=3097960 RepID=UPI002E2F697A|nr:Gfo/Idh/MocA family oxidoreductase [Nonomuraea sp. LP-02]MED7932034.1 Gfo/Idh/MocA family oxidoreductase [Nonomuraea sp. LP-02]